MEANIEAVYEIIDGYADTLDNYIRDNIKNLIQVQFDMETFVDSDGEMFLVTMPEARDNSEGFVEEFIVARSVTDGMFMLSDDENMPLRIADAVCEYIRNKHCGDAVMAAASMQLFPKYMIPVLRNDIIKALS